MKRENIQQHLESDKPYKSRNEKKNNDKREGTKITICL